MGERRSGSAELPSILSRGCLRAIFGVPATQGEHDGVVLAVTRAGKAIAQECQRRHSRRVHLTVAGVDHGREFQVPLGVQYIQAWNNPEELEIEGPRVNRQPLSGEWFLRNPT